MMSTLLAFAMAVAAAGPPPLRCGGPYVPPTDYDRAGNPVVLEYAVASGQLGETRDAVGREAQRALVSRLCRLADPASCGPLEVKAKLWSFGQDASMVCAMAVIASTDLEAWRTMLAPDLEGELRRSFEALFPEDQEPAKKGFLGVKKKKKRSAVVMLERIDDNGAPGGVRADWLLGRVRAALTTIEVDMVDPPRGWTGRIFPKDVEFSLQGTLLERVDPKSQLPVLDVAFTVRDRKGFARSSNPFSIPAALAPPSPTKASPLPPSVGLALHVESQRGGSLCPGDFTQIHVTNETNEPLFVRVINLDQAGEALVLFPNETQTDDLVPAGATIPLSPDGFTVDGAAHGRERYLAIGARSPDALGRFRDARGTCRYRPDDALKVQNGAANDAPFRGATGFTLLDDVRCRKPIPLPDPKLSADALADLPLCPPLER
jgi:hypothetical protein